MLYSLTAMTLRPHIDHTVRLYTTPSSAPSACSIPALQQFLPTGTAAFRAYLLTYLLPVQVVLEILMTNFHIRVCSI